MRARPPPPLLLLPKQQPLSAASLQTLRFQAEKQCDRCNPQLLPSSSWWAQVQLARAFGDDMVTTLMVTTQSAVRSCWTIRNGRNHPCMPGGRMASRSVERGLNRTWLYRPISLGALHRKIQPPNRCRQWPRLFQEPLVVMELQIPNQATRNPCSSNSRSSSSAISSN